MFIDLMYELLVDTSPVYLYVGIFLSVISTINLVHFDFYRYTNHARLSAQKSHNMQTSSAPVNKPIGGASGIMAWIILKTKHLDAPDDDDDDDSFCFRSIVTQNKKEEPNATNICIHNV